jgi:hypothetical protein
MWLRDGHHLLEEPRHAANDVVPSAPFAGEPAPRHHERPHQPRDQQPVEHQTLDEPRFNEEDAPQDTTTGDAAGVPPQEGGGPRHAQDVHNPSWSTNEEKQRPQPSDQKTYLQS